MRSLYTSNKYDMDVVPNSWTNSTMLTYNIVIKSQVGHFASMSKIESNSVEFLLFSTVIKGGVMDAG